MLKIEELVINKEIEYEYIKNIITKNLIENFKYYKYDIFKNSKLQKNIISKLDEIIFNLNIEDLNDFLNFLQKNYTQIINDNLLDVCLEKLDIVLLGEYHIYEKVKVIELFNNIFENFSYDNSIIVSFFENFIKNIDNRILLDLFLGIKNLNKCHNIKNWHILQNYILSLEDNNEKYIIKLMNIIDREQKINFLDIIRRKIYDSKKILIILSKLLENQIIDNNHSKSVFFKNKENKFKSILKKILISFSLNNKLNLDFLNIFNLIDSKFDLINDKSFMKIINIEKVIINISNNLCEKSFDILSSKSNKKKYIINIFYLVKFIKLLELKIVTNKNIKINFDNLKKNIFLDIYTIIKKYHDIFHLKIYNLEEINYNHVFDNKKQILQYILLLNLIIDKNELDRIMYIFNNITEKSRLIFDKVQLIKYIYKNKKTKDNKIFEKIIDFLKENINKQYEVFFFERKLLTYNNFIDHIYYEFQIYDKIDELFLEYENKYKESDLSLFNNVTLTIDSGYINRFKKNVETTINIINENYDISKQIIKQTKQILYECQYLNLESVKDIEKRYKYLNSKIESNYEKDEDEEKSTF